MIAITSQIILWILLIAFLWYVLKEGIPRDFLRGLGLLIIIVCLLLVFLQPTNTVAVPVLRVISLPIKPLGGAILLLILATRSIKKGNISNIARNQIYGAVILLLIFSTPFIAYGLAQQIEKSATQLRPAAQGAPVIVVLGWGTTLPKQGARTQIQLTDTGDRIRYAADLYRDGIASRIVVSAGRRLGRQPQQNVAEANDIKTLMIEDMRLSSDAIIVEPKGVDVQTSAIAVKELLRQQNLGDNIYLVTSALNMRRAALTFANRGMKVIPRPTNFYTTSSADYTNLIGGITDLVPSTEALALSTRVIDEYLISIYYFMRGWLSAPLEASPLAVQESIDVR